MKQSHAETLSKLTDIEEQMEKLFEKNATINDNRKALKKALKENNQEVKSLYNEYMAVQANHPAFVVIRRVYMVLNALFAGLLVWAYVSANRDSKEDREFEKNYDVVKASMVRPGDTILATSGRDAGKVVAVATTHKEGEYVWINEMQYLADDYVDAVLTSWENTLGVEWDRIDA